MLIVYPSFVDRDMFMRYLGGGTCHTILQGLLNIKDTFRKILEGAGLSGEDINPDEDDDDEMIVDDEDNTLEEEENNEDDSDDSDGLISDDSNDSSDEDDSDAFAAL